MKDLSDYRKSYDRDALLETNVPTSPFSLFENWFQLADAHANIEEANAMTLTTVGEDNTPLARVVLLKKSLKRDFDFSAITKVKKEELLLIIRTFVCHFFGLL